MLQAPQHTHLPGVLYMRVRGSAAACSICKHTADTNPTEPPTASDHRAGNLHTHATGGIAFRRVVTHNIAAHPRCQHEVVAHSCLRHQRQHTEDHQPRHLHQERHTHTKHTLCDMQVETSDMASMQALLTAVCSMACECFTGTSATTAHIFLQVAIPASRQPHWLCQQPEDAQHSPGYVWVCQRQPVSILCVCA